MISIKNLMLENPILSKALIFPFAFLLSSLVFSFFLELILPVVVAFFLTKWFFNFITKSNNDFYNFSFFSKNKEKNKVF